MLFRLFVALAWSFITSQCRFFCLQARLIYVSVCLWPVFACSFISCRFLSSWALSILWALCWLVQLSRISIRSVFGNKDSNSACSMKIRLRATQMCQRCSRPLRRTILLWSSEGWNKNDRTHKQIVKKTGNVEVKKDWTLAGWNVERSRMKWKKPLENKSFLKE
jgi:hypothetical protein